MFHTTENHKDFLKSGLNGLSISIDFILTNWLILYANVTKNHEMMTHHIITLKAAINNLIDDKDKEYRAFFEMMRKNEINENVH